MCFSYIYAIRYFNYTVLYVYTVVLHLNTIRLTVQRTAWKSTVQSATARYNGLDRESNCRLRDPDPTLILNRILDTVVLKFKSKDKKNCC